MGKITNYEIAKKIEVCFELLGLLKRENVENTITKVSINRIKLIILELFQEMEERR